MNGVRDVADLFGLAANWLNAGPTDLLDLGLPEGFRDRTTTRDYGGLSSITPLDSTKSASSFTRPWTPIHRANTRKI